MPGIKKKIDFNKSPTRYELFKLYVEKIGHIPYNLQHLETNFVNRYCKLRHPIIRKLSFLQCIKQYQFESLTDKQQDALFYTGNHITTSLDYDTALAQQKHICQQYCKEGTDKWIEYNVQAIIVHYLPILNYSQLPGFACSFHFKHTRCETYNIYDNDVYEFESQHWFISFDGSILLNTQNCEDGDVDGPIVPKLFPKMIDTRYMDELIWFLTNLPIGFGNDNDSSDSGTHGLGASDDWHWRFHNIMKCKINKCYKRDLDKQQLNEKEKAIVDEFMSFITSKSFLKFHDLWPMYYGGNGWWTLHRNIRAGVMKYSKCKEYVSSD
eukprot:309603_1